MSETLYRVRRMVFSQMRTLQTVFARCALCDGVIRRGSRPMKALADSKSRKAHPDCVKRRAHGYQNR